MSLSEAVMRGKKRKLVLAGVASVSVGLGILADPAGFTTRKGERAPSTSASGLRCLITTAEGGHLASIFEGLPGNPEVAMALRAWRRWEGCSGKTGNPRGSQFSGGLLSALAAWFNPPSVFACSSHYNSYLWADGCGDCRVTYCQGGGESWEDGCDGYDWNCNTGGECHAEDYCYNP